MTGIKIIANYLPQFHEIPENNKWWGEGFTDWVAVKKSVPLYENHNQPRVPLNNHYYKLDDVNELRWQADLANQYNVYGFGMYHYWFSSTQNLLCKPAELIRDNKDIDIHYMFIWDNISWARTWSKFKHSVSWSPEFEKEENVACDENNGVLAQLVYGDKSEWKKHFEYLLTFFNDERYIKIDNKPLFVFYQPNNEFETIKAMSEYWDELAVEAGFNGLICVTRENWKGDNLDYRLKYSPTLFGDICQSAYDKLKRIVCKRLNKLYIYDYDLRWRKILQDAKKAHKGSFLSGFVDYDDSPRRAERATIAKGAAPEKFYKYMKRLLQISKRQNKEYVFVTAWNEWGESAYLEPDETNGYEYLKALKKAVDEVDAEQKEDRLELLSEGK